MNRLNENKDPAIYTAFLFFIFIGIPLISLLGMFSNTQPTPEWSRAAIPLSLLFFIPIVPRGIRNAKLKLAELSTTWKLITLPFGIIGISIITIFIWVALTRSLPTIVMPLVSFQYEKVMTIESITGGGRRVCSSGTRISVVDATKQLRTSMCMRRDARNHFQAGQKVWVRGYSSWFAHTFDEMQPISNTPSKGPEEQQPLNILQSNKSKYLGLENVWQGAE